MAKKDELGRWGEAVAAEHLRGRGYRLVERNWRCRLGEIDIVASEGGDLVVVEVKTRSTTLYGHPFEAITPIKLGRLHRLGLAWRSSTGGRTGPVRIDVVSIVGSPEATVAPEIEVFRGVRA